MKRCRLTILLPSQTDGLTNARVRMFLNGKHEIHGITEAKVDAIAGSLDVLTIAVVNPIVKTLRRLPKKKEIAR